MIAWRRWHFRGRVFKSRHPKISKRRAALRWHEIGRFLTQSGNGLRIGGLSSVSRSPFRHIPHGLSFPRAGAVSLGQRKTRRVELAGPLGQFSRGMSYEIRDCQNGNATRLTNPAPGTVLARDDEVIE